jgi:hypothetical protein
MAILKIWLKTDNEGQPGSKTYGNEVNGKNYKDIALVLKDLKNLDLPIDKAIKEFKKSKSDWEAALQI